MTPTFHILGASGILMKEAQGYTGIIVIGAPFFVLNAIINGFLTAHGDTKSFRNMLIIGFLINIALDPLFMGTFKMGIKGIALATILVKDGGTFYLWNKANQWTSKEKKRRYLC